MSQTAWKLLSVSEFLDRYRTLSELNVATDENSTSPSHLAWQKQTVQTFFAHFQWSPKPTLEATTEAFGLGLSVQSYFQHFVWDAPIPSFKVADKMPEVSEGPDSSLNLQNFSDLF